MKKLLFFYVLGILTLNGCQKQPKATIADLKTAVVNESTASIKYLAYASRAREEGYESIAVLFNALARSEKVHAERCKEFMDELEIAQVTYTPTFDMFTTEKNIIASMEKETLEIDSIYPKFINDASAEKMDDIAQTMKGSLEAEINHLRILTNALKLFKTQPDALNLLAEHYLVCPICGNVYESTSVVSSCTNCNTSRILFTEI